MVLLFLLTLAAFGYLILSEIEKPEGSRLSGQGGQCTCGQHLAEDWLLCPRCSQLLRASCFFCGRLKLRDLPYCPHCGSADERTGS